MCLIKRHFPVLDAHRVTTQMLKLDVRYICSYKDDLQLAILNVFKFSLAGVPYVRRIGTPIQLFVSQYNAFSAAHANLRSLVHGELFPSRERLCS